MYLVTVRFRCREGEFRSAARVVPGTPVLVEGDRGVDYGVVSRISDDRVVPRHATSPPRVLRAARESEMAMETLRHDLERNCLDYLRGLTPEELEAHGVDGEALAGCTFQAVEFQYDLMKLCIFYNAARSMRFSPLAQLIFRQYKCRVWIHRLRSFECFGAAAIDEPEICVNVAAETAVRNPRHDTTTVVTDESATFSEPRRRRWEHSGDRSSRFVNRRTL